MSSNVSKLIKQMLENRAMLFTDIHFGIRKDSEDWFNTAIAYGKWLRDTAIANNINTLIFLGDFFHDREELRMTALNAADKFLEGLKDFNIIMVVGNHDCWYKDNTTINSVSIFDKWENIVVVDKLEVVNFMEKKIAFMPWGVDLNDVPTGLDYIFGHLEISSFKQNKVKICEHGLQSADLLKRAGKVYSGHFHLRTVKKYKNGTITYVGNTYQQDWGDYEEDKGVEIVDFSDGTSKFILNDVSPRYVKVHLSKLMAKDKDELKIVKTQMANNIVKLIVDQKFEPEKLSALSEKLSNMKPMQFNTEQLAETDSKSADDFESVEIDMKLLLTEYVGVLDIEENKDKVLEESLNLYSKALSQIKDDTND